MNQELARKRPANVAPVRRAGYILHRSRDGALAELKRRQRAGGIETAWPLQLVTEGRYAGMYAIRVTTLPERPDPRWAVVMRNVGIGLLGLAAIAAVFVWFITALTTGALVAMCLTVLGVFSTWVWARHGRRHGTTVTVTTTVQMR